MKNNKRCWWLAGTRLVITLTLQTVTGVVFGQTTEPSPSSAYTFVVVEIPDSDGQLGSTDLRDINDSGQVVGGLTSGGPLGLLLDKFELTEIQCPTGVEAAALSLNKRGDIAGFCGRQGFFRRKTGAYTMLDFPGAILTEAVGINDEGDVVGDYRDSAGTFHGFVWDEAQFRTIDVPFPEAILGAATGINNVGQIVGFYDTSSDRHGYLYDGSFTSIDLADAVETQPEDINDRGQIVGTYADRAGAAHGFLLDLDNGTFTTIDAPFPGVTFTTAQGINNKGQIVGRFGGPSFGSRGFVATPNQSSPLVTSSLFQPGVKNDGQLCQQFEPTFWTSSSICGTSRLRLANVRGRLSTKY
jgi:probable HAF family extracellular repeat protein